MPKPISDYSTDAKDFKFYFEIKKSAKISLPTKGQFGSNGKLMKRHDLDLTEILHSPQISFVLNF